MNHDPNTVFPCDGKLFTIHRKQLGLTQKELALKSGYSERLIRKAEAGGRLNWLTINDLAKTFSNENLLISPEELVHSPEMMVRKFWEAYSKYEAEMLSRIHEMLDENIVIQCAGDPQKIPFAGEFHGHEGFEQWITIFFSILTRPNKNYFQPTYLVSGNRVVTWGEELASVSGILFPPLWVTQRFLFRENKLVLFENVFDTEKGSKNLAEAKAHRLIQGVV